MTVHAKDLMRLPTGQFSLKTAERRPMRLQDAATEGKRLEAMSKKPFYVSTPIYYVNDKPHLGHAYTTVACGTPRPVSTGCAASRRSF